MCNGTCDLFQFSVECWITFRVPKCTMKFLSQLILKREIILTHQVLHTIFAHSVM
jgi:hypothetical protein